MKNSAQKIRTSHVGNLPPPKGWEGLPTGNPGGQAVDRGKITARLDAAVLGVVRKQLAIGIDCIGDGEFWNGRSFADCGRHLSGVTTRPVKPGEFGATRENTRERDAFPGAYADMDRVGTFFCTPGEKPMVLPLRQKMVASGPLKLKPEGMEAVQREIASFKTAMAQAGDAVDEAFICVLAPGWLDHFLFNEHYKTDEEFVYALAETLRPQYQAVVDAGFILQIDDPGIATSWDMIKPEPTLAEYHKYSKLRIDALNQALTGIPEEKVRYHFCWGSWHGPHTGDVALRDIVELVLQVRAQTYSFEASNVRHEHEWRIWKDVTLPAGKLLMPGVVSHATNIVEHPDLVAERLLNFAGIIGRENVIGGTDCGLGARVHAEIAWAKLATLVEGARRASKAP